MTCKKKHVVIVSVSTDYNRGDQALLWENQRLIQDILGVKEIYIIENDSEELEQSAKHGLQILPAILHHPSYTYKKKYHISNRKYNMQLKVLWGLAAIKDFCLSKTVMLCANSRVLCRFLFPSTKLTIQKIKDASAIFVKGGGFLHTYGKISDLYYIYYSLYYINLALRLNKKVFILPNSFGPINGRIIRGKIKRTLKKCCFVSCRESLSKSVLDKLGINKSFLFPDMAFALPIEKYDKYETFFDKLHSDNKKLVAITVRPYRFPEYKNSNQKYESYLTEISDFIDLLFDDGFVPILVEHTFSNNDNENDRICINEIKEITRNDVMVLIDRKINCEQLKYLYSNFSYIVGTRFHSVVFSMGVGVPGVAISYSGNKTVGIMKDMGLGEYVVEAGDITAKTLKACFDRMVMNEVEYKNKVGKYISKCSEEYESMCRVIKEIVE
ncbi:MAG: polysaccharide pyruvyl transferase family protein [Lachnospiraceae bacterium]|nr:polysaccharide pyruvyl transferase family protein [Lachnospiraceae bacterium]